MVDVKKINESFLAIDTNKSIARELNDYFSYYVPNYHILRKKNPRLYNWDGKIKLFDQRSNKLPFGLLNELGIFCKNSNYTLTFDVDIKNDYAFDYTKELDLFIEYIQTEMPFELRDYQIDAFKHCINRRRLICVSATGSGKTVIIYLLARFMNEVLKYKKILIITPVTSLVEQLSGDFKHYGYNGDIHKIYGGCDKVSQLPIYASTWQSIYEMGEEYFKQFDGVILDEAHSGVNCDPKDSKAIKNILEKCINAKHRIGLTGTLRGEKSNLFAIISLLGDVYNAVGTKELIERQQLSNFKINIIKLQYNKEEVKHVKDANDYNYEMDFIETHKIRNNFICKFVNNLENNTLLLFRKIEHGNYMYEQLVKYGKKKVYYIDGGVSVDDREDVRRDMEKRNDIILVGSMGTMAMGINIKNLHNIIFSISYKSEVKILQSIGRSLRLHNEKDMAVLFDFVDCLGDKSFSVRQAVHRIKNIYIPNQFEYEEFDYKFS